MRKIDEQKVTPNPNDIRRDTISQGELDERARALATIKIANVLMDPTGEQLLDMSWLQGMMEPAIVCLETMNEMREPWYQSGNGWRVLLDKSYHASRARGGHMLMQGGKLAELQLTVPPDEPGAKPYDLSH